MMNMVEVLRSREDASGVVDKLLADNPAALYGIS
jgi:hypothetical protein